ncbi:siderophore-interacting protein [Mangrovitalea sediminis]|uniref:siderophore-interacting protein n=1 Tax=Mangrovitalea sediminis TaxID=1982043 RepID=UPI000BE613C0|nr:siderophore-interacting protein [Mangrovitalea sediminis]
MTTTELAPYRVRHPLKFRLLQVARTETLSPRLRRITLTGDDLAGFTSASFNDHIKLMFPLPGQEKPVLPMAGPNGPVFPEDSPRPPARDYTPRRYNAERQELDIDFVLHGDGPASTWAATAKPGDYVGTGGPRGSLVIPAEYDWHLLVGDETALPAIARRLEELPEGKPVFVIAEVADSAEHIGFDTRTQLEALWVDRDSIEPGTHEDLEQAVRRFALPEGDGFIWAAGENSAIRAIRRHLVGERGFDKTRIHAASYWKRGSTDGKATLNDDD